MKRRQWYYLMKYHRTFDNIPHKRSIFGFAPDRVYEIASKRYVCLSCRKSWRRSRKIGNLPMKTCPHCAKELTQVPVMLRTPKRSDKIGWRELQRQLIARAGK